MRIAPFTIWVMSRCKFNLCLCTFKVFPPSNFHHFIYVNYQLYPPVCANYVRKCISDIVICAFSKELGCHLSQALIFTDTLTNYAWFSYGVTVLQPLTKNYVFGFSKLYQACGYNLAELTRIIFEYKVSVTLEWHKSYE